MHSLEQILQFLFQKMSKSVRLLFYEKSKDTKTFVIKEIKRNEDSCFTKNTLAS